MMGDAVRQGEQSRAVCPLGDCQALLGQSELLGHLFSEHLVETPTTAANFGLRMRKVRTGECTLLLMVHQQLVAGHDHCLGVLNWTGDGSRNLSPPQLNLPLCHRSLCSCLPVLVMVCKTTWPGLLLNSEQFDNDGSSMGYLYVFWLVAPATQRPVCATLGFLNRELQCGLRVCRQLRNFATRMHINQFLLGADRHYLTLSESQMDQMCSPNEGGSFLEVVIVDGGY